MFSIVILTYNSDAVIRETLRAANSLSDDIHVVDSFSTDGTLAIVQELSGKLVQRKFENYAIQRNWANTELPLRYEWVLHLDADERPDSKLMQELLNVNLEDTHIDGYFVNRSTIFLGKTLNYGGLNPQWHMRLFRREKGRCEDRLYDQHFFVNGRTAKLAGRLIDDQKMTITEWVSRHNRWADLEANEVARNSKGNQIRSAILGNPVERKRFQKKQYYALPLFIRPLLFFCYRYFLRLGFLDGRVGLIYFVLQSFWFRFLVDAKIFERTKGMGRS